VPLIAQAPGVQAQRVARMFQHAETAVVSMAQADMSARGLRDGDLVRLRSRRGSLILPVAASADLRDGQVFLPMHWGSQFIAGLGINALTLPTFDPHSKQPELKHAAVSVEKIALPWQLVAISSGAQSETAQQAAHLRPHLGAFEYAAISLFGSECNNLIFRAAASVPLSAAYVAQIDRALGFDEHDDVLHYVDRRRDIGRKIRVHEGKLIAVRLSGDVSAQDWLKDWLELGHSVADFRRALLSPSAQAPRNFKARGRIVCNCLNVSAPEIDAQLATLSEPAPEATFAELQARLQCGTQCGSCVPELRRIIDGFAKAAA
jgi:assimilatory nitrate reductase catalytic subunit